MSKLTVKRKISIVATILLALVASFQLKVGRQLWSDLAVNVPVPSVQIWGYQTKAEAPARNVEAFRTALKTTNPDLKRALIEPLNSLGAEALKLLPDLVAASREADSKLAKAYRELIVGLAKTPNVGDKLATHLSALSVSPPTQSIAEAALLCLVELKSGANPAKAVLIKHTASKTQSLKLLSLQALANCRLSEAEINQLIAQSAAEAGPIKNVYTTTIKRVILGPGGLESVREIPQNWIVYVLPDVRGKLRSKSELIQTEGALNAAQMGFPAQELIPDIIELSRSKEPRAVRAAVLALERLVHPMPTNHRKAVLQAAVRLADSSDVETARSALRLLSIEAIEPTGENSLSTLRHHLANPIELIAREATAALANRSMKHIEFVLDSFKKAKSDVRARLAASVSIHKERILPILKRYFTGRHRERSIASGQCLSLMGTGAVSIFVAGMGSKDEDLRKRAMTGIILLGSTAVEGLTKGLTGAQPSMQAQILFLLGQIGPDAKSAGPEISQCLKSGDSEVLTMTLEVHKQIGLNLEFDQVAPFLKHASPDVRLAALQTLEGKRLSAEQKSLVKPLMNDEIPSIANLATIIINS